MSYTYVTARVWPLLLIGAAGCALARPEQVYLDRIEPPGPLTRQLDHAMRELTTEGFSGTVLVSERRRMLLYKGYSESNRARELPNTAETRFPIGALQSEFAAGLLRQLNAEGRVDLDQPAAGWLDHHDGRTTLRELLGSVRDEPGGTTIQAVDRREPAPARIEAPAAADDLERVLVRVTGRSLPELYRERLFQPYGLGSTRWEEAGANDSLVARGYAGPYGETIVVREGLVAPLGDLWRWHQAMVHGGPGGTPPRAGFPAGPGWVRERTPGGELLLVRSADARGFQLWYGYAPARDILILIAVNNDLGLRRRATERLVALAVDGAAAGPGGVTKSERSGGS
jgi:CubicO group peptidase (beta-lactamase class C family)